MSFSVTVEDGFSSDRKITLDGRGRWWGHTLVVPAVMFQVVLAKS